MNRFADHDEVELHFNQRGTYCSVIVTYADAKKHLAAWQEACKTGRHIIMFDPETFGADTAYTTAMHISPIKKDARERLADAMERAVTVDGEDWKNS